MVTLLWRRRNPLILADLNAIRPFDRFIDLAACWDMGKDQASDLPLIANKAILLKFTKYL
jgi:hypothetical protein